MTFLIATHNPGKLAELRALLTALGLDAAAPAERGLRLDEVAETGDTFRDNAYLKARAACEAGGLPAIADDSGLCVDALGGAPGVYSARYAGVTGTPADCNRKLLAALADVPPEQRTARFVCAVCCVFPDGTRLDAEGVCEGVIAPAPRGEGGFGYDPLFLQPDGRSFAQLTPAEKDAVSHRGRALRRLINLLEDYYAHQ